MVMGVGLDLAEAGPWERALSDPSPAALEGTFTAGELAAARAGPVPPAERLAARYAAKEAFVKALGASLLGEPDAERRVDPREIEVVSDDFGRPALVLHGEALALTRDRGVRTAWLSLTHDGGRAAAVVLLEG